MGQTRFPPQARELFQKMGVRGPGAATAQTVNGEGRIEADPAIYIKTVYF
jgi:hypothetical protein